MKLKISIFTTILLLSFISECLSKCPLAKCTVNGTVHAIGIKDGSKTSLPASGAIIYVFIDENESTLSAGYKTCYPDHYTTDINGDFKATSHYLLREIAYYETKDGKNSLVAGKCMGIPNRIEVIVTLEGYLTKRIIHNLDEINMIEAKDGSFIIELPVIKLKPSHFPGWPCQKKK